MKQRTLKLTDKEIELLKAALNESYIRRLESVKRNRKVFGEEISSSILEQADTFDDLKNNISTQQDSL